MENHIVILNKWISSQALNINTIWPHKIELLRVEPREKHTYINPCAYIINNTALVDMVKKEGIAQKAH